MFMTVSIRKQKVHESVEWLVGVVHDKKDWKMSNVSTLHEKQTTRNYCHFFVMEREKKIFNACCQIMIFEVMKQHDFITHRRCCLRLIMQAALHKTWHIICKCEKFNKQKNKQFLEAYLSGYLC